MAVAKILTSKPALFAIIGLLAFLYFGGILRRLFKRDDPYREAEREEKAERRQERRTVETSLRASPAFDPNFYLNTDPMKLLDDVTVARYAKDLRGSMRFLGTRESKLFAVFDNLKTKAQISQVSAYYYKLYKRSLIDDIERDLNTSDEINLLNKIKPKPLE